MKYDPNDPFECLARHHKPTIASYAGSKTASREISQVRGPLLATLLYHSDVFLPYAAPLVRLP